MRNYCVKEYHRGYSRNLIQFVFLVVVVVDNAKEMAGMLMRCFTGSLCDILKIYYCDNITACSTSVCYLRWFSQFK